MQKQPLPFRPISQFYRERFGGKVYKIPVSLADDCPNRRGLRGMKTCSFCDVWGSAARAEATELSLNQQIDTFKMTIGQKFKAEKFLIYFQAFTTTFTKLQRLRDALETASQYEDVVGFVIGTRPDCISPALLDLWQEYHEKKFVSIELGAQSFNENQLRFLQRGHTAAQSLKAIEQIAARTSVDLSLHFIFGLPGETENEIAETARICNQLPIQSVKLHNLHVLKNTQLEKWHAEGLFEPADFLTYARAVRAFIGHLHPRLYIHRLAAYAPRWDELIAPNWTADKMRTHQGLVDFLHQAGSFQGCMLQGQNPVLQPRI